MSLAERTTTSKMMNQLKHADCKKEAMFIKKDEMTETTETSEHVLKLSQ